MPNQSGNDGTGGDGRNEIQKLANKRSNRIDIYCFSAPTAGIISFPAFVTAFTDTYKSNWNKEEVYGRMDPISTFKNTTRVVSLGFDIPNASYSDARRNLKQIDTLIRGLYPVYDEGMLGTAVLASPPYFRVRFANLIRNVSNNDNKSASLKTGLLCFIENFQFTPKVENGFFTNNENVLYPKLITVTLDLNIIHEHPLGHKKTPGNPEPRLNFKYFPHEVGTSTSSTPSKKSTGASSNTTPTTKLDEVQNNTAVGVCVAGPTEIKPR